MKKFLSTVLLLCFCIVISNCQSARGQTVIVSDQPVYQVSATATFNTMLDLLRSAPTTSIVFIKSFHPQGSNGGGFFVETAETANGYSVYAAANGKRWKRTEYRNTPQNYGGGDGDRYISYSQTEINLLYPANLSIVPGKSADWCAIQTMRWAASEGRNPDLVKGTFYINEPTLIFKGKEKKLEERWPEGSKWISKGTSAFTMIQSFSCISKKECTDVNTNYSYVLSGLEMKSAGPFKGKAVELHGFQLNLIERNVFIGFDTAMVGLFMMNSTIMHNEFRACRKATWCDRMTVANCGTSGCQSNAVKNLFNRFYITPGTEILNGIVNASDYTAYANSYERQEGATAVSAYYFNSLGASVVKDLSVTADFVIDADHDSVALMIAEDHVEVAFTKAFIDARMTADSKLKVTRVFNQFGGDFVSLQPVSGYVHAIVEDCYYPNTTTFSSLTNGCRWSFIRQYDPGKQPVFNAPFLGKVLSNTPKL